MFFNPRYLADYLSLRRWEDETIHRGKFRESRATVAVKKVPWSSVGLVIFCFLLFGIDLMGGIRHTAAQLKQGKLDSESKLMIKNHEQRKWSIEEGRRFRDGEMTTKFAEEQDKVKKAFEMLDKSDYPGPGGSRV